MSKPIERVEIITGHERRRRYSAEERVRPSASASTRARRTGSSRAANTRVG